MYQYQRGLSVDKANRRRPLPRSERPAFKSFMLYHKYFASFRPSLTVDFP